MLEKQPAFLAVIEVAYRAWGKTTRRAFIAQLHSDPGPPGQLAQVSALLRRIEAEESREDFLREQAWIEERIERRLARGQGVDAQRRTAALLERVSRW